MTEALADSRVYGPEQFAPSSEGIEIRDRQSFKIQTRLDDYAEICWGAGAFMILPPSRSNLEHKLGQSAVHRDTHQPLQGNVAGCSRRSLYIEYPCAVRAEASKDRPLSPFDQRLGCGLTDSLPENTPFPPTV